MMNTRSGRRSGRRVAAPARGEIIARRDELNDLSRWSVLSRTKEFIGNNVYGGVDYCEKASADGLEAHRLLGERHLDVWTTLASLLWCNILDLQLSV